MSHRDSSQCPQRLNSTCLKMALCWLLRKVDWSAISFRDDCTWTPRLLTATAMLWAWSDEMKLSDRLFAARRIICHAFQPQQEPAETYQGFVKLLRRWTNQLIGCFQLALRTRLPQELPQAWRCVGFVVFGVDGSRAELPRTRSHEQAYSTVRHKRKSRRACKRKSDKKKSNSPQLWLTTMWHVGSGLPWDWRIGPADSSERAHSLEMLPHLPPGALIAADAGFVGYQHLNAILSSNRHFVLRVGSNVRLLKQLGYARESAGTVYLWPDAAARKLQQPLVLRLVVVHNGKHPVYLVTNVLSQTRLTDRQVVELYARRWGIELFYRHLKQTYQRRKLRSTNADNALVEMHWSMAGLCAMAFYALAQLHRAGFPAPRLSIAHTLRTIRRSMRDYLHPAERGQDLRDQLCHALIDDYPRKDKTSRDYPRKKQERQPGPPKIATATKTQIQLAQLVRNRTKKGLPA